MERKGMKKPADAEENVRMVGLEEISYDDSDAGRDPMQVRQRESTATINKYATAYNEGAQFPPITLAELDGKLFVVDGFHRMMAQTKNGATFVAARVVKVRSMEEARSMAGEENLTHGLPLQATALHEVFRRYVKAGKHRTTGGKIKSSRKIAEELHGMKSHNTIIVWMYQDFPRIAKEAGWKKAAPMRREKGINTMEYRRMRTIEKCLGDALEAFSGVSDQEERGIVIHHVEEFLESMKSRGDWKPYEKNTDF